MACSNHSAIIYDRGARSRFVELDEIDKIDWGRVGDDISLANVSFRGSRCSTNVKYIEPGRHELVVFRGTKRVWEGPVTLMTFQGDHVDLQARDVMHYAERTIMKREYDNSYPNITTCIKRSREILVTELARIWERLEPPIMVVPFLKPIERDGDSKTSRKTIAYEKTVFDDIDDMARYAGMDYTVVGRSIILFDTDTALGRTPTLTDADLIGNTEVTVYGMETASLAVVTGAEGQRGMAVGPNGHPDRYYGAWEILDDAYDEESGTDRPTQAELNSQAERNVQDRIPTPVALRIPDNSTLAATSPLYDPDLLVPGVQIPVLARFPTREISQIMKLREVKWSEDENGETVTITTLPTSSVLEDADEGGV